MADPKTLLAAHEAFLAGHPLTAEQFECVKSVTQAACFAAAAYDAGMPGGQNIDALARAFLLALIDPTHPDLDYLRTDPASGKAARDAADRLRAIATPSQQEGGG